VASTKHQDQLRNRAATIATVPLIALASVESDPHTATAASAAGESQIEEVSIYKALEQPLLGIRATTVDFVIREGVHLAVPYHMAGPFALLSPERLLVGTPFGTIALTGRCLTEALIWLCERKAGRVNALLEWEADPEIGTVIERIVIHYGKSVEVLLELDEVAEA
jgi:hypothetical protein